MTRWRWLLALPWIVIYSTGKYKVEKAPNDRTTSWILTCDGDDQKYVCEDLAAALNDAHERRTKPLEVVPNSGRTYKPEETHSITFEACTADSCGKEPK